MKAKSFLKLLVIKEICSWLPPGLKGRNVCSQEHISLITNSFISFSSATRFLMQRVLRPLHLLFNDT